MVPPDHRAILRLEVSPATYPKYLDKRQVTFGQARFQRRLFEALPLVGGMTVALAASSNRTPATGTGRHRSYCLGSSQVHRPCSCLLRFMVLQEASRWRPPVRSARLARSSNP